MKEKLNKILFAIVQDHLKGNQFQTVEEYLNSEDYQEGIKIIVEPMLSDIPRTLPEEFQKAMGTSIASILMGSAIKILDILNAWPEGE